MKTDTYILFKTVSTTRPLLRANMWPTRTLQAGRADAGAQHETPHAPFKGPSFKDSYLYSHNSGSLVS